MSTTYDRGALTVSISERPFFRIADYDKYAKPRTITCSQCDAAATHRVEREEFGMVIRMHYCKPCFDVETL